MGFTPFPTAFTSEALDQVYDQIEAHGDMILHHMDDGIPWDEALGETAFPTAVQENLDFRKSKSDPKLKMFLTSTAARSTRNTLAGYFSTESNGELPDHWKDKRFNDPDVIKAYINYCRRLIDFFNPDYYAYGIEVNASFDPSTQNFQDWMELIDTTYTTLKADYPTLPIMLTFQTQTFKKTQKELQDLTKQMLPYTDYIALSHYPYWIVNQSNQDANPTLLPKDWIKSYRDLAPNKPFVISESGYAAEDLLMPSFDIDIKATEEWQKEFVDSYLPELNQLGAEFVMWFFVQDYDKVWEQLEPTGAGEEWKIWKDTGLIDGDNNPRPALQTWDDWLALPKR